MNSKVVLYYKSLVQEDRNFVLDDSSGNQTIADYLNTLTSVEIDEFQYIKHDLVVSIKLDKSQTNLELGNDDIDLNYVSISNYSENAEHVRTYERIVYYFVAKKNWKAQNTIELVLHMDTLNTFQWNEDYTISPKTLVHRMHKDRFANFENREFRVSFVAVQNTITTYAYTDLIVSASDGTIVSASFIGESPSGVTISSATYQQYSNGKYFVRIVVSSSNNIPLNVNIRVVYKTGAVKRLIDMKSENISTPLYKKDESTLYDNTENMIEWSLYYKNSDNQQDAPVDCFLIPNAPLNINYQATAGEINTGNLDNGKWAYFYPYYPNQPLVFSQNGYYITPSFYQKDHGILTYTEIHIVAIHNNSGTIELYDLKATQETFFGTTDVEYTKIGDGNVSISNPPAELKGYMTNTQIPSTWDDVVQYLNPYNATTTFNMSSLVSGTMKNLQSIDKTLSENIKIIHVPYSPTPYSENNGVYEFASCWSYNTTEKTLKLTDFSYRWEHTIETNVDDILQNFLYVPSIVASEPRHVLDSKLYHSDYYLPKFVYDSFNKGFNLELFNFEQSLEKTKSRFGFNFKFVMSRNLQSKFLFKFDYVHNYSLEDYENILAVARNNEEALYSSQYLNYVRTGYNYDVKAKQRQEEALKTGLALSGGSMLASTLVGLSTGNPMALGTGLMSGMSFYGQIVNYAKTSAQAEENIQRKLEETKRQANSVLNADDYDLMYEYAQNKPKLCYYQISERMTKVLDDLFYYCGYSVEEQMIPVVNTRRNFNFVQADLKIVETSNLTSDIESDIIEKFSQGVTFIHKTQFYGATMWDLEQENENWELALLGS